jgi:hypothetical protein
MSRFHYRCPTTGAAVAGWQADEPSPSIAARSGVPPAELQLLYIAERCPACAGLHIVNPATGRMLSDEAAAPLRQIKAPRPVIAVHL